MGGRTCQCRRARPSAACPLPRELGTNEIVKARLWPWLELISDDGLGLGHFGSGVSHLFEIVVNYSLLHRQRNGVKVFWGGWTSSMSARSAVCSLFFASSAWPHPTPPSLPWVIVISLWLGRGVPSQVSRAWECRISERLSLFNNFSLGNLSSLTRVLNNECR